LFVESVLQRNHDLCGSAPSKQRVSGTILCDRG
jgi:hypothetical protein